MYFTFCENGKEIHLKETQYVKYVLTKIEMQFTRKLPMIRQKLLKDIVDQSHDKIASIFKLERKG